MQQHSSHTLMRSEGVVQGECTQRTAVLIYTGMIHTQITCFRHYVVDQKSVLPTQNLTTYLNHNAMAA